ncbi:hypothetical protein SOVF_017250 [Spinacia oleracea]|nr:hypothetical protein SOVF_017250 [Spinacia oleracea]
MEEEMRHQNKVSAVAAEVLYRKKLAEERGEREDDQHG